MRRVLASVAKPVYIIGLIVLFSPVFLPGIVSISWEAKGGGHWIVSLSTVLAASDPVQQAGLVIRFGDGAVEIACISFVEESISGRELLQRSPFKTIVDPTSGMGEAICKIGDTGCDFPAEPCFCHCQFPECEYWAYYWQDEGGSWTYAQVGAASRRIRHGDVDGWSWGEGESGASEVRPPTVPFAEICPSEAGEMAQPIMTSPGDDQIDWYRYGSFFVLIAGLLGIGVFFLWRR